MDVENRMVVVVVVCERVWERVVGYRRVYEAEEDEGEDVDGS